ncbi:hypothetical protein G6F22_021966 [Rhizopus arrhizus]|nr:hypothetical protein G6F22_021966 [Rhizopus arrhizus]KAG1325606.1 hypothetical protein G6F61_015105 [Rhizopus arrhizus]KAG1390587.1 hypothetical protein G6F59_015151 [Rhizopus arrhizus]
MLGRRGGERRASRGSLLCCWHPAYLQAPFASGHKRNVDRDQGSRANRTELCLDLVRIRHTLVGACGVVGAYGIPGDA